MVNHGRSMDSRGVPAGSSGAGGGSTSIGSGSTPSGGSGTGGTGTNPPAGGTQVSARSHEADATRAMLWPQLGEAPADFFQNTVGRADDGALPAGPGREEIDHAQDLAKIATGARRVGEHQANLLERVDDEHGSHRRRRLRVRMDHVVRLGDRSILVRNEREVERDTLRRLDVPRPALVVGHAVHAQAEDLHAAAVELGLEARDGTELGRAHGRVVARVREEDCPAIAEPVVKTNLAGCRDGGEVGGGIAESEGHRSGSF